MIIFVTVYSLNGVAEGHVGTSGKSQRNKLKLEKLNLPSTDVIPIQYANMEPMQYGMEQKTGYPHRPPQLRLQSRRTSISMDDVVRRTNSGKKESSTPPVFLSLSVEKSLNPTSNLPVLLISSSVCFPFEIAQLICHTAIKELHTSFINSKKLYFMFY
ncbi:uncharacterized protein CEXT_570491 [Caerostris extrusa]|uniref:Uncharacterized protein n=1 Tax=Caerostris extrusa TaxID=172846 RepID=A0AAV4TW61_CAEEX|nr:uncharacterized protein CEXT_570491 [Caerostris extrusa]